MQDSGLGFAAPAAHPIEATEDTNNHSRPLPDLLVCRCRPVPQGRRLGCLFVSPLNGLKVRLRCRDCRETRASSAANLRATLLSPRSGARSPRSSGIPQAIVATPVAAISGISSAGGMPPNPPVVRSYAPPRVVVPAWAWLPSPKPACRDPIPSHEGPPRHDLALLPTPCRVRSQNPIGHPKQNATRSACPSFTGPWPRLYSHAALFMPARVRELSNLPLNPKPQVLNLNPNGP